MQLFHCYQYWKLSWNKNWTKVCLNAIGIEDPNFIQFFNSKIIYNEEEVDKELCSEKLSYWLTCPKQYFNVINKINLLYRGSQDGFLSSIFHDKCDYKGETFALIKSTKGYIFGGFTKINLDSTKWNGIRGKGNCSRRNGDGDEFVFTLRNPHNFIPTKYNIKDDWKNHFIYCDIKL